MCFYLPILLTYGLSGIRLLFFFAAYESMLDSLLRGWAQAKPDFDLGGCIGQTDWEVLRKETIEWVQFYNDIEVGKFFFSFHLNDDDRIEQRNRIF